MLKKTIAYLLLFLIAGSSCKKENALDCFKSNGSETTEVRYPGTFSTIQVADKIEINISQGNDYKVEIKAGKNLLHNISTSVSGGTLHIANNNTCNFVRGYKKTITINVTLPYLEYVKNDGVGTIRINDLQQDTLLVRTESSGDIYISGVYNEIRTSAHGNGDMYISGSANSFYIYSKGTNFVHAEDLIVSGYMFVHTLTLGDCFVNGTQLQELAYNIGSTGNIYYTGNPPVINDVSEVKSKGEIIGE